MGVYRRGNGISLVERFYVIDPVTEQATLADPSTVTFTVRDPDDVEVSYVFGIDANVTHVSTGIYVCDLEPPLPAGDYVYSCAGTGLVVAVGEGTFTVLESGVLPPSDPEVAEYGPCTSWIDGDDVADYDPNLGVGSETYRLDDVASMASQVLFSASGRQFAGICERTVRPCSQTCGCWGYAAALTTRWAWSYLNGGWNWFDECGDRCGCGNLSYVRLAGYPVREIIEVKVGGEVVSADGYRLDGRRNLIRLSDPGPPVVARAWPGCQNLALADTEPGTFSVKYTWGVLPPALGKLAAAALAAELYKAIAPDLECKLPSSMIRVVRQGVTIERVIPTAKMIVEGSTGIQPIDVFLAMVNPTGRRMRSAVWTPDRQKFARRVGQ